MLVAVLDLTPHLDEPGVRSLLALSVYPAPGRLERALEAYRSESGRVLLGLAEGGALVGCIGIEPASGTIRDLGVRADCRGRGLGRALIFGSMQHLGLSRLQAETDRDAVGFYRACGCAVTSLGEPYPGVERFRCVLMAAPAL